MNIKVILPWIGVRGTLFLKLMVYKVQNNFHFAVSPTELGKPLEIILWNLPLLEDLVIKKDESEIKKDQIIRA